ncbi:heat stress transcription factor A-1e [Elysia marginata]|uniref:Heat stress transcription factor A-1e n=1 Tax=Elysia marginata TaxID=1093978 RepID=A0AAV4FLJ1_9GAST|nr:heat stress transcription factor A-1e [Elysia marginata]
MSRKQTENKFMLEVLQVYQTLPSLWKVKSEEYHNRQRKIEDYHYQALLKKYKEYFPGATLEELKKKLNTLRTGFRTELRKINRSAKSGAGLDDL